jgi:hypothetical protein
MPRIRPLLTTLMLLLAAAPLRAEPLDAYRVADIDVRAQGATVQQAKARALARGRSVAVATLFKRITLPEDHARLPRPTAQEMRGLEIGFEIQGEKSTATRYSGTVAFRFDKEKVRAYLQQSKIAFVDAVSKPVLMLAIWRGKTRTVLWDDPNPWRVAWDATRWTDGLVPFVKARGDLKDLQSVSAAQAAALDPKALAAIAASYGAGTVLVATAVPAKGIATISVKAFTVANSRVVDLGRFRTPVSDPPMRAIAKKILAAYELKWKRDNKVPVGVPRDMTVHAPLDNYAYWVKLRAAIAQVQLIRSTSIVRLSPKLAVLKLSFVGSEPQLMDVCAQNGLNLVKEIKTEGEGEDVQPVEQWTLRLGRGGGPTRVRERPLAPPPPKDRPPKDPPSKKPSDERNPDAPGPKKQ